jgi:hypothetical protein
MTIESFFEALAVGSVGGSIIGIAVVWFGRSYLAEKGKNLATKEDVAAITKKIEEAKQPFFELQEHIKASHQLRFAAIDKRLQVHQDSFTVWLKMLNAIHAGNKNKVAQECKEFWQNNCLYLDASVRDALNNAIFAAVIHSSMLSNSDKSKAEENWEKIMAFPKVLFEAVNLTPISPQVLEKYASKPASDSK